MVREAVNKSYEFLRSLCSVIISSVGSRSGSDRRSYYWKIIWYETTTPLIVLVCKRVGVDWGLVGVAACWFQSSSLRFVEDEATLSNVVAATIVGGGGLAAAAIGLLDDDILHTRLFDTSHCST